MSQKYHSNIFNMEWTAAMNAAVGVEKSTCHSLTLANVCSVVWDPAFDKCLSILQKLRDRSIKLALIDWYFRQDKTSLKMQLENLQLGVNACRKENNHEAWIAGVVCSINEYWNLCNYQKAASAFLDLKKVLHLQGDFSDIEKLSTDVSSKC